MCIPTIRLAFTEISPLVESITGHVLDAETQVPSASPAGPHSTYTPASTEHVLSNVFPKYDPTNHYGDGVNSGPAKNLLGIKVRILQ